MQPQSPGQGQPLRIPTLADQILHLIAVTHRKGGLLNNRTIIQLFRDVMRRGTNQFHATIPGAVIRLSAFKRR